MSQVLSHFDLDSHPFGRTTPPEAILRHKGFVEAHSRLRYTVELDGIAVLLSDSGCGKSLLLSVLTDELQQEGWGAHYFAHATIGPFSLVNVLARKAGVAPRRSRGETAMALSEALLDDERRHLLVIDEAHVMPDNTLEDVRLLTIADFDRKSPFLLLLAGQMALDDRLAEPTHYALDQRVTAFARLLPLSPEETAEYLRCRLAAAGAGKRPILDDGAVEAIHGASDGVPRRINNLATAALIVAAARGHKVVTAQDIVDARLDRGRS